MTPVPPRVAVDAHTIGRRATGNETYVVGLLRGLHARSDVEAVALVDDGITLEFAVESHSTFARPAVTPR
jgi:hypothetical protein